MKYTSSNIPNSALVTIDAQIDFAEAIEGTYEVSPNIARLLSFYRQKRYPIIHVIRLYKEDGTNADLCRREMIENGKRIAAPNTKNAELIDKLKPSPELGLNASLLLSGEPQYWNDHELLIYKPRWGAFYNTKLESILRSLEVDTIVFCGCNFPNCPRTSIYEASERDFRIVLIEDAVSQLYEKGKQELIGIGVEVIDTEGFLRGSSREQTAGKNASRPTA